MGVTPVRDDGNVCSIIPDFTSEGLLPLAEHGLPYACTRDEVRQRFVLDRGSPDWRVRLFDGWDLVRSVVAEFVPTATWWLWGVLRDVA